MTTLTVKEKIDRASHRALAHAIGLHGSSDVEIALQDTITDALHALEVLAWTHEDDTDPRRRALRIAECAVANYLAEAHALREQPNESEDILGGYENPNVHIAQADDAEPLYV